MYRVLLKSNALCSILIFIGFSIGIIQQVNSSVIPNSNSSLSSTNVYSGWLSSSNPTFIRPTTYSNQYYYQMIKVTVYTSGTYSFTSSGTTVSLVGCLYNTYFNPSSPSASSLIGCNDGSASGGRFQVLNQYLESDKTYILIVTTSQPYMTTSSYQVTSTGAGSLYAYMSTYTIVSSISSGSLGHSNPKFNRPNGFSSSSSYYYDSYDITISQSATYSFQSTYAYSIDPYGCLYQGSFNPSNPTWNQLMCNDDGAGAPHFLITQNLDSSYRYILVITSFSSGSTGTYSFKVTGPSYPTIISTTIYTHDAPIGIIIGGTIGFIFIIAGFIILIGVCRRRNQHKFLHPRIVQPQYNINPSNGMYPNVHQVSYGNPPPYNAYMATNK